MEVSRIKVLVTGSKGQLGSEIRVISDHYTTIDFTFTDIEELDITNENAVHNFINYLKPDFVINCAAYTAVDKAEQEVELSNKINSFAPKYLAKACRGNSCKLIHISTDYVFDGKSTIPYTEASRVNPLSQYGISKLYGEEAVLAEGIGMVIRTSWLYSSFGNNFVKTILLNAKIKPELRVVSDQLGCPTYARDLAEVILAITSKGKSHFVPEIFHYSNEGSCSWYNFASEIVSIAGLNCIVNPIETKDWKVIAVRPQYSVFSKSKICNQYNITIPHWRVSLSNCIDTLRKDGLI